MLTDEFEHLRFTLDHIGAYVYTKDLEGRYTYANSMVRDLFGAPLDQIVGKPDDEFFDLSETQELLKHDQHVLATGERSEREERNIIAQTREERFYWAVKLPIHNTDGKIIGLCGISTDITERRRLERELEAQKNLLSSVLENMDASVYMKGKDRKFRYVNAKTVKVLGMPAEDIVGKTGFEILPNEVAHHFELSDRVVFEEARKISVEETVMDGNGEERHYWSIKIPVFNEGEIDSLIGMSTNITEIVNLKNRFRDYARFDELTGVLTRRFLLEQATAELIRAQRRGTFLAALMMDLDNLKHINDNHGHAMGDKYILSITQICQNLVRNGEFMGRLGGDEFVVIITDVDERGLTAAVTRFYQAICKGVLQITTEESVPLSVSIGAALSTKNCDLDMLLAEADRALYKAKENGRCCWKIAGIEGGQD